MVTLKPDPKVLEFLSKLDPNSIPPHLRGILEDSAKAFRDTPRPEVITTYEERLIEELKKRNP